LLAGASLKAVASGASTPSPSVASKAQASVTADYVLEYRNIKLAVVEAKAWDKPLTEGVG